MNTRGARLIASLATLLIVAAGVRLLVTSGGFAWPESWVYFELRAHSTIAAIAIGAALSVSGVVLQSMLRNPLASEYVLGLTAGAGLGVVVATYIAFRITGEIMSYNPPAAAPVIGAAGALGLVYALGRRGGVLDPTVLILVGVIIGIVCAALTTLFQYLLPDQGLAVYTRWLMGNISGDTPWPRLWGVLALAAAGTAVAAWLGPWFDAASLGDDEAASVGVPLRRLRVFGFVLASALTGSTVLLAGPIGFIGLVCPHLVRRLSGASHRSLMVASALCGSVVLLVADAGVTAFTVSTGHLPVGVLTALIGGPLFIVMLRSRGVLGTTPQFGGGA